MNQSHIVSFFRHAKTDKVKPDSARRLTDEGKAQARRRREMLGNPTYSVGYCSPRERTRETLHILAGTTNLSVITIQELIHDESSETGKLMNAAFEKFGYAAIGDYISKSDSLTRAALIEFGQKAWSALGKELQQSSTSTNSIVVGHAVLIGFIIMAAYPNARVEEINKINLGECEGVRLIFDKSGDCTGMEMLQG